MKSKQQEFGERRAKRQLLRKLIRHCVTVDGRKPDPVRLCREIHYMITATNREDDFSTNIKFLAATTLNLHRQCQSCTAFIESMCTRSVDLRALSRKITDELSKAVSQTPCSHIETAAARATAIILDPNVLNGPLSQEFQLYNAFEPLGS